MNYRNHYAYEKRKSFFYRTSINNILILINVIAFVLVSIFLAIEGIRNNLIDINNSIFRFIALNPDLFFKGYFWTLLTSMFMHAGFGHLFVNMVSMFFIGSFVERLIGRKRYLWFYLISGLVAGLFFIFLALIGQYIPNGEAIFGNMGAFAVGASGALFGLGGLLAVLIPKLKVLVFFIIPMPMWLAMGVLMFGLWAISAAANLPVGNTAHFGGLIVGVIYGFYLRSKHSKKVKMLNRMFG